MDYKVVHDPTKKQFYINLTHGEKAVLDYEPVNEKTLDMYHTEVPIEYRGKGIAEKLATSAFDYAVEKDYKILPTCTYIQKFASEHKLPQYVMRILSLSKR